MNILRINPHIRYAGIHTIDYSNTTTKLCYDCRLFHIEKGSGVINANGKKYKFSNNTTMVIPAATVYSFEYNDPNIRIYVINFDFTEEFSHIENSLGTPSFKEHDKDKIVKCPIPDEFSSFSIKEKVNIASNLEKICDLFMTQKPYYRETSSALLKLCLVEFVKKDLDNKSSRLANDVMNYVYEHYWETELTNNGIAEFFGYHPYYLNNVIKSVTGQTLHKQLVNYRLSVAMNYLVTTEWDINTVSWKSGFGTVSYFIKAFREKNGMTPHKYRSMYRNL